MLEATSNADERKPATAMPRNRSHCGNTNQRSNTTRRSCRPKPTANSLCRFRQAERFSRRHRAAAAAETTLDATVGATRPANLQSAGRRDSTTTSVSRNDHDTDEGKIVAAAIFDCQYAEESQPSTRRSTFRLANADSLRPQRSAATPRSLVKPACRRRGRGGFFQSGRMPQAPISRRQLMPLGADRRMRDCDS